MKLLTFEVEGMTCGGCSASVQRVLERKGLKATVSRNPGRAVVEADDATNAADVEQAIAAAGFPARLIATGG
jgi:copper chaperone CopZ